MNAQSMLEQMLKSALSMVESKPASAGPKDAGGASRGDAGWGKFGAGAATGGALGLLLGSKGGRRLGGKALKYGSVAALGVVAFKAYSNWQAQQAQQAHQAASTGAASVPTAAAGSAPAALPPPRTVDRLPAPQVEVHSRAMLQAMIAAAKADGHLDERERGLVEAELQRIQADDDERRWIEVEMRRPLDPAEVARAASTPELAAEMYLASLLVADQTSFMERAYLDELARQLRLPDGLKAELERQAQAA